MDGTSHKLVQVPPGVQCFVGDEARRRRLIEEAVISVFEGWDYQEIIPPLFDYADVFASRALASKTYSFVGRDGSLLALRPDFTSLLAKIAAGRLAQREAPIRLYYSGEVLRYEPPQAGRQSELFQMGLEHLGGDARAADSEILAIAAECLSALGARDWVLAVGHVGVFGGLLAGGSWEEAVVERLRARVEAKDPAGVRDVLAGVDVSTQVAEAIVGLTGWAGDGSVLEVAEAAVAFLPEARQAVAELKEVVSALKAAGLADHVAVDLAEVRGLDYYTGLVFRAYAPGLGFEVGGGGRYDALLARFGRPLPAVGFMFGLDRLALLLDRQGAFPHPPPLEARLVEGDSLGLALRQARRERAQGVRVRLADGGKR